MKDLNITLKSKKWITYIIIVIFSVCTSLSLVMNGDDYIWYFLGKDHDLDAWLVPNGRFFSNKITLFLINNVYFRTIFVSATLTFFLILMAKLFDFINITHGTKFFLTLICFIMIPHATYADTVKWISGYTNYVFSMLIVFVYLFFVFKCIFDGYKPKKITSVFFLLLSFIGGLCIEHITIYNVIISVIMLILALKINQKCVLHAAFFLVGAFSSCFVMFYNPIYSDIYSDSDKFGIRFFIFDMSDIMQNAFSKVVLYYTKSFWLIPIIITLSFSIIYLKSDLTDRKYKYLKPCIFICWLYSSYAIFTNCVSNLRDITPAMKIIALETAFSFIYVVSIAYLIYVFLDKKRQIRSYIYLISSFVVTAAFIFVSPVTSRCFFSNYMFWILLCGEILTASFKYVPSDYYHKGRIFVFAFTVMSSCLVLTACLTNKYIDTLRYNYIKEQLQNEKSRSLNFILLPYTEYDNDDLKNIFENNIDTGIDYEEYILKYHNIDPVKVKDRHVVLCSPNDYYIENDE